MFNAMPTLDELQEGECVLPNGCTLFWKMTEVGRFYYSDEIGGGVQVWQTALVDEGTLMTALAIEKALRRREA